MVLLNWLFQDELIFQALARSLAEIISRKEDRYIALGWCNLVHGLIEYEITMNHFSNDGNVVISVLSIKKSNIILESLNSLLLEHVMH